MRKLRTLTDPSDVEGLEPGGELDGREVVDSRPMAIPVKPVRDQLGPLDKMYADIRAREQLARDAAYQESDDEAYDLDVPEELDEFLSRYEEHPLDELLGSAMLDKDVQTAIRAALEGRYGEREALGLKEYQKRRGIPDPEPPQAAAGPSPGDEAGDPPSPPPAKAGKS